MKTIIFSGFLGAGKTTLIKKLVKEGFKGEKVALIENEFGEIGVDGGFLKECGITVNEINSGCICCSLVGDFTKALGMVITKYSPQTLLIEPSGVGKLSDVIKAVRQAVPSADMTSVTVVDATKCKMYSKNFGEFFKNQIEYADTVILSHTANCPERSIKASEEIIKDLNPTASLVTTDWDKLDGRVIVETLYGKNTLSEILEKLLSESEDEHEHHHHDHDDDEHEHHHHDHDGECSCGCGHHHADEVFTSYGYETTNKYTKEEIENVLENFDEMVAGTVLRSKGIVESTDGRWIHFDYTPGEVNVRFSFADVTGKICVIGSDLNEDKIKELFRV